MTKQDDLKNTLSAPSIPNSSSPEQLSIATPAQAFWHQREMLAKSKDRIKSLSAAVGRPTDFTPAQWAQIAAFIQEFRPDLILELGRGLGNSTACFVEVAHRCEHCRVLSLCLSDGWRKQSVPEIKKVVSKDWFEPLEALECDILRFDIATRVQDAQRVAVFWDAHGFEVAEWVLGELLPRIAFRPHIVMMHDLSDMRYCTASKSYGGERLWKGINAGNESMWLGHIFSRVAQSVSIIDFATRNKLPLHSGDESFFGEIGGDPGKSAVLKRMLGDELFRLSCHWFWFTLAEAEDDLTFPAFQAPQQAEVEAREIGSMAPELDVEMAGIGSAQSELLAIKESRAWRAVTRFREFRDRLAPENSWRRKIYNAMLKPRKRVVQP